MSATKKLSPAARAFLLDHLEELTAWRLSRTWECLLTPRERDALARLLRREALAERHRQQNRETV